MTDIDFAQPRGLALSPFMPSQGGEDAEHILFLKRGLNRLGYYVPEAQTGMTPILDRPLMTALYAYQRAAMIALGDTEIGPNSATSRLLHRDLANTDDNALYIWRTVKDDKVRGEHAARNGQTFSWNTPPEGGHPGEDYNCRCWAEPVNPAYHHGKNGRGRSRKRTTLTPTPSIPHGVHLISSHSVQMLELKEPEQR